MKHMTWLGPDGHRYQVELVQEPGDRRRSVIFRCEDPIWIGVASALPDLDLLELSSDDLARLLGKAAK